ncbi:hypothetical protein DVS28_a4763 [Euzebya pacifica]|uniref:Uncharacterized protein n=1 Tax=Euzebya pacifica TaxID=1608957 RepID=A0A346Y4M7_9ACTN|nr:hypothetical protein DVS28_a4763 [Euzebya pacifica]
MGRRRTERAQRMRPGTMITIAILLITIIAALVVQLSMAQV